MSESISLTRTSKSAVRWRATATPLFPPLDALDALDGLGLLGAAAPCGVHFGAIFWNAASAFAR